MPYKFSRLIACAIATASTCQATFAQEAYPVIDDNTLHKELPNDGRFDILGFSLLQNTAQFDDVVSKSGYEIDWTSDHEVRGLRDRNGNQVAFRYGRLQTKLSKPMATGWDSMNIRFTSNATGNRVFSLRRSVKPEQQYDLSAVLESLEQKYGKPSFIESASEYRLKYTYLFNETGLLRSPDGKTKTPEIKACYNMRNVVPYGEVEQEYAYLPDRQDRYSECSGAIYVELNYGARKDLVKQIDITMFDYELMVRDLRTQDRFLLEALNAEIASKTGAEAPKL